MPRRKPIKRGKTRRGGLFGIRSAISHLGSAYLGYKAPQWASKAKQSVVNTFKKLPGISHYAAYNKQKAQAAKFTQNSQAAINTYNAIKQMKYNPFGPKNEQINQGTRGMFTFKDTQGKTIVAPRDMTVDTAAEVADRFKVSAAMANWRGLPNVKPYDPNAVFNVYSDAAGHGKRSKKR